ncbi:unnamed protein product [Caenorhabditis angaria]|uniref:Uncharacterized protein n=1 Tax=Caenorhabditis angaria TaxID=860376 RepID=A0A9P1N901_9PELO|nr:unnamed protein product [Caenorhabditis angaria]
MSVLFMTLLFVCFIVVVLGAGSLQTCTDAQQILMPCVCCKKECWFTATEMATEYYGHMPGTGGQSETQMTLQIMRTCMQDECGDVCKKQ